MKLVEEVLAIFKLKEFGLSLKDIGVETPISNTLAQDLLFLDYCIKDNQQKQMNK